MTTRQDAEIKSIELVNDAASHQKLTLALSKILTVWTPEETEELIKRCLKGDNDYVDVLSKKNQTVIRVLTELDGICNIKPGNTKGMYVCNLGLIVPYRNMVMGMCLDYVWDRPSKGLASTAASCKEIAANVNAFVDRNATLTVTKPQEPANMTIKIEHKTLINGRDITDYTDAALFANLASAEAELEKLKAVKTKSKKLEKAIADAEQGLLDLAAAIDAR